MTADQNFYLQQAGMGVDLRLIGARYSIISLIFFIPYAVPLHHCTAHANAESQICPVPASCNSRSSKDWAKEFLANHYYRMGHSHDALRVFDIVSIPRPALNKKHQCILTRWCRWDQMVGLRVVLGIFEAGFFPVSRTASRFIAEACLPQPRCLLSYCASFSRGTAYPSGRLKKQLYS